MNIFLHFQKIKKNSQLIKAVGFLSIFVFSFLIFSHISIAADAGRHIGYQGQLLNSSGVAQSGTYTMDFDFYDALSGGSQQGSTITKSVTVSNGYFSVDFSESDLSGIIFNQDLWMELTVSGTTLSPRSPVNSVPYSNVAFGVIYGSGAPALSNPADGALYFDTTGNDLYVYDGSSWATVGGGGGVSDHSDLTGLQGGNGVDEYYHLNFSNYSDLTDVNAQLGELTSVGSPSFASVTADMLEIADKIYFYATNDAFVGFDENSFDGDEMLTIAASNDGSGDGAAIRLLSYNRDYQGGDINGLNLYAGTNGWISNFTNGIDRLDISPTGGVGIGTSYYKNINNELPPGDKLTVFGNIGNIFDETRQDEDIVQLGTVFNSLDTIPPRAIAMKGSNLFVIDSANVRIYSLKIETDPNDDNQPTITGYVDFVTGNGNSIKIAGDYAYVGESNGYIEVFDISNPDVMLSVGSVQPTNFEYVNDIEINGRYLYALGYEQGSGDHYIRVIDITNPESPIEISSIAVPYLSNDLSISDNMMYVTNTDVNGINTYSLADPVNLSLINNQSFPSQPVKSIASGNYLYTISSSGYLYITDRRDTTLANYAFLTEFNLDSNGPYDIFISGRYAYIVTADGRLFVVDVKSSINPLIVKNIELPFVATNVIVQGKKVVLAGGGSVAVFDAPGIETSNALVHSLQAGNVDIMNDLHIDGNVITNGALNVGNGGINSNGAVAINGILTLGKEIYLDGSAGTAGQILTSQGAGLAPIWADASGGGSGLQFTSNQNITQLGNVFHVGTEIDSFDIQGHYVYSVDTGIDQFSVFNFDSYGDNGIFAFEDYPITNHSVSDVKVSGNYAYTVGFGSGYLQVIDITVPNTPILVTSLQVDPLGAGLQRLEIKGKYLFILGTSDNDNSNHLYIVDISDPNNPFLYGDSFTNSSSLLDMYMKGNYIFSVDNNSNDVFVFDTKIPGDIQMFHMENIILSSGSAAIAASDDFVYVVNDNGDFNVIDYRYTKDFLAYADPLNSASIIGTVSLSTIEATDIFIAGRYAYISNLNDEDPNFQVVDVSDPTNPILINTVDLSFKPYTIKVQGNKIIVSGRDLNFGGSIAMFKMSGFESSSALIHSLEVSNLSVEDGLSVNGNIKTNGGLNVGAGGILSNGDIGVYGNINLTNNIDSNLFIGLDSDENISITTANSSTAGNLIIDSSSGAFMRIGNNTAQIYIGNPFNNDVLALQTSTAVTIQGSATTCSIGNGTGTTSCTSDERLKQNVTDLDDDTLLKVLALRPVTFNWNSVSGYDQDPTHIGLIAQEVQGQFEDAVHTVYHNDTLNDDVLGVDYGYLVVPAIKAIQQQQALLGDIATLEGMTMLVTDIQNENAHDPVAIINEKINTNKKFLTDFVVARVTAIRGYFDEIFAKKATLDEVCLKDADGVSCYTRSQLDAVVNDINVPVQSNPIVDTTSDENTQDQPVDTTTVDTSSDSENTNTSVVSSSEETVTPPVDEAPVNSVPASEPTSAPEPAPTE